MNAEQMIQWLIDHEGQATFIDHEMLGKQVWVGVAGWPWMIGGGATLEEAIQDAQQALDRLIASDMFPMKQDDSDTRDD